MSSGWIKLYRQLQDCYIWLDKEPFDKRSAWVDLLLTANHSDKKILFNGELITVKRGQILTSIRKLAERWKWSYDKTSRFLKLIESDGMLRKESDNCRTLLTIENYELYQDVPITDRTPTSEHTEHQQVNIPNTDECTYRTLISEPISDKQECKEYKNEKNDKNVKNEKKEKKEVTNVTKKKEPAVYYPNDELLNNAFNEFLVMRNKIKRPIATKQALTRMMNKIDKLSGGDNDLAVKILNQSTDHCWQDVSELKEGNWNSRGKGCIDWDNV